jgi:hypothetical protein
MKRFKFWLLSLLLLVNLVVAQPSWADRGKFVNSSDYAEVTAAIQDLLNAKADPAKAGLKPEEIAQKLATLQFQKYILETADDRAQITNQTGKTLAIFARYKKAPATQAPTLYYLANGQTTDDDYDAKGVYLPSGTKVSLSSADLAGKTLTEPLAVRNVLILQIQNG